MSQLTEMRKRCVKYMVQHISKLEAFTEIPRIWQLRGALCKRAYKPHSTLHDNTHRVHSLSVLLTHRPRRIFAFASRTACNDFPRNHPRRLVLTRSIRNHAAVTLLGLSSFFKLVTPPKNRRACTKLPTSCYGSNSNSTRSDSVDESILRRHLSPGLPEPVSEESADVTFPAHLVSTYSTVSSSLFVRV